MNKNNLTIIVSILAVVILAGAMIWTARPDSAADSGTRQNEEAKNQQVSGGQISADQSEFSFGSISMAAGKVKKTIKLSNSSGQPVKIRKIYTSCMCTAAILTSGGRQFGPFGMPGHGIVPSVNQTIAAGQSAELEIIFDPAAHGPSGLGKISRVVAVETDSGSNLEIAFDATVTP